MFKSYHQQIITIGISIHSSSSSSSRYKSYIIHIKIVVDLGQIMNFKKWWLADEFFSLISNFWILLLLLPPSTTPWFIIWLIRFFLFSFDFGPRKKMWYLKTDVWGILCEWFDPMIMTTTTMMMMAIDHSDDDDGNFYFFYHYQSIKSIFVEKKYVHSKAHLLYSSSHIIVILNNKKINK